MTSEYTDAQIDALSHPSGVHHKPKAMGLAEFASEAVTFGDAQGIVDLHRLSKLTTEIARAESTSNVGTEFLAHAHTLATADPTDKNSTDVLKAALFMVKTMKDQADAGRDPDMEVREAVAHVGRIYRNELDNPSTQPERLKTFFGLLTQYELLYTPEAPVEKVTPPANATAKQALGKAKGTTQQLKK